MSGSTFGSPLSESRGRVAGICRSSLLESYGNQLRETGKENDNSGLTLALLVWLGYRRLLISSYDARSAI